MMLTYTLPTRHVSEFAEAVREGLLKPEQRELASKYLYDEGGSALFETICLLPEYGLTRADPRLLPKYAREIGGRGPSPIHASELLGTDWEKSVDVQLLAYDDPAGVTAAFNLNLLARLNRELDADFDLSSFHHEARWNTVERRIEMHLRSTRRQCVRIPAANLRLMLEAEETIWTESSHKYRPEEVVRMAERTGFRCDGQWIDEEWPFAQNLLVVD